MDQLSNQLESVSQRSAGQSQLMTSRHQSFGSLSEDGQESESSIRQYAGSLKEGEDRSSEVANPETRVDHGIDVLEHLQRLEYLLRSGKILEMSQLTMEVFATAVKEATAAYEDEVLKAAMRTKPEDVSTGTRVQWFKHKEDAQLSKNLLGEIRAVAVEEWDGKGRIGHYRNGFIVVGQSYKHQYFLKCAASTPEEKQRWMEAVASAIKLQWPAGSDVSQRDSRSGSWGAVDLQADAEKRKTTKVGRFTAGGVVGGALLGSMLLPVVGTAVGAAIGGYWVNRRTKARRDRKARAAAVRKEDYARLKVIDTHCYKCNVEFSVSKRREYCVSCCLPYCLPHCSRQILLPQLGECDPVAVCDQCYQRQDFINFIFVLMHFVRTLDEFDGHVDSIVRGSVLKPSVRDQITKLMQSKNFDLLYGLSLLHFLRDKPEPFVVVLAQMTRFVECHNQEIEFYWTQLTGFVRSLMISFGERFNRVQLVLYSYFIRAIARRSPHLKLLAAWEFLAIYDDAVQSSNFLLAHQCFFMLLMVVSAEEFGLFSDLWLRDVPQHQMEHMTGVYAEMEIAVQSFEAKMPSILFWNWLFADSDEDITSCRAAILQHEAAGTLFDALSIYPEDTDAFEPRGYQGTRSGLSGHLSGKLKTIGVEGQTCDGPSLTPSNASRMSQSTASSSFAGDASELCFEGMANFVKHLTDIAEDLRHVERSERKKILPTKLGEFREHLKGTLYIPTCSGGDPLKKIIEVVESDSTVFSTKARAPTLVAFEVLCTSEPVCKTLYAPSDKGNSNPADTKGKSKLNALQKVGSVRKGIAASADNPEEAEEEGQMQMILQAIGGMRTHSERSDESEFDDLTSDSSKMEHFENLLKERPAPPPSEPEETDANGAIFETWEDKIAKRRAVSPHGHLPGWSMQSVIAKSFDDMRQEVFTLQLIDMFNNIFLENNLDLWLLPYRIVCTGPSVGLIETLHDSNSIDGVKKKQQEKTGEGGLWGYFLERFGPEGSPDFENARANFISSMAAYSAVCYFLQIKDRHNGNIMVDKDGHVIHIDFGFILGIAPGGRFSLETAPFKLTVEMVDIMGGLGSQGFIEYQQKFLAGFAAARRNCQKILALVALTADHSPFPCFVGVSRARLLDKMKARFMVDVPEQDLERRVLHLIESSYNHWGTTQYDNFQKRSNGILP